MKRLVVLILVLAAVIDLYRRMFTLARRMNYLRDTILPNLIYRNNFVP